MLSRWQTTRHGSAYVALATAASAELRRAYAKLYPPVSHVWQRVEPTQLHAPLLCASCFAPVHPEHTTVVRLTLSIYLYLVCICQQTYGNACESSYWP